jgi:hypothetical protein
MAMTTKSSTSVNASWAFCGRQPRDIARIVSPSSDPPNGKSQDPIPGLVGKAQRASRFEGTIKTRKSHPRAELTAADHSAHQDSLQIIWPGAEFARTQIRKSVDLLKPLNSGGFSYT